jgi:hypothetical protein
VGEGKGSVLIAWRIIDYKQLIKYCIINNFSS